MNSSSRLRLALLGADASTPALVRAILAGSEFELIGVCQLDSAADPQAAAKVGPVLSRIRQFDVWESLLDLEAVDAVVVARRANEDERAEHLRKLIQSSVPLLVSHPVVESMLVYYELEMIRQDTNSIVLPLLFERHHPAVEMLASMVAAGADSPIGKINQLVMQRSLADPTRQHVLGQFARDVDLVRAIAGDMTRLGAMASGPGETSYASLGVQMSGPSAVAARWSVAGVQSVDTAQITLLGTSGKATLEQPGDGSPWKLVVTSQGPADSHDFDPWDPAAAALAALHGAIRRQRDGFAASAPAVEHPDWVDAARSVELAETIDRSLNKGRTIELYYEDYTEAGTFKGTMASIGCGLLLLGLFLMGAVAIAEQAGVPYTRYWPVVLVGLLGVFLVLQLLVLVSRKPEPTAVEQPDPALPAR